VRYFLKKLPKCRILFFLLSAALLTCLTGCREEHYQTDMGEPGSDIEIRRFEQDLFSLQVDSLDTAIQGMYEKYGEFFDLFNYRIINIGGARLPTYPDYLKTFLTDYLNFQVYNSTIEAFPDLSWLEIELGEAFQRYRLHFPDDAVPEVYTFVSRFNHSIVTAEKIIGIGLDNYLGADTEYYEMLGKHNYQSMNMHPRKIPSDCLLGWGMTEFEYKDSIDNVLSNIIYQGKMAYFTKWMLPHNPDSLIMGFTADQMRFCRLNEKTMWEYLVEHKILFESDMLTVQKFTGNGPFTGDFTRESPARAAVWVGWRIIEAYARRNPRLSLDDIMHEDDYQKILTLSRYNPR